LAVGTTVLAGAPASSGTLTLGSVEEDVQAEQAIFRPLQDYLEEHLAPYGVDEVRLVVETSIVDIGAAFDRGDLDLYLDSPVLTAMVARAANARPFLRSWKEGVSEYSTIIYVRADSPFRTLDQLRGHVVAFKKRESTPGYFMPRGHLAEAGLATIRLDEPGGAVPADQIGYVFSHGDHTTLGWVMTGRVAAGVMKDDMMDAPELRGVRDRLRVIAETTAMPRQVLARRGDLDAALVDALRDILTGMHATPAGAAALEALDQTAKFDPFPDGGEATFARIWTMLDMLEASLEPGT
jgi:phosphonate transport system substrate-binding protein